MKQNQRSKQGLADTQIPIKAKSMDLEVICDSQAPENGFDIAKVKN